MQNVCYVDMSGKNGKFLFPDISPKTLTEILTYKSWMFTSWDNTQKQLINYLDSRLVNNGTLITCKNGVGFVPVLIKHLTGLGFTVLDYNGRPFNPMKECIKVNFTSFKFQLRDYQYNASLKWQRDKLGVIKAPTGSGKSIIACHIMGNIGYKTLILIHTIDLVEQWKQYIIKSFGLSFEGQIGTFGGGHKLVDVIDKDVIIGTYQTALKKENIKLLSNGNFGLGVFDECIPIDSIIHTDRGEMNISQAKEIKFEQNTKIKYFDLDKQTIQEAKYNIFETKIKDVYATKLENNKIINSSIDHKFLTNDDNIQYKTLDKCKNIGFSLIENYDMDRKSVFARLFGYLLGDGNVNKKNDKEADFYGKYEDFLKIKKDLKFIGYDSANIVTRHLKGEIQKENGEILNPEGIVSTLTTSGYFGRHIVKSGYPAGNKTNINYEIPDWIMNADEDIKREFLAGFLGAEGSVNGTRLKRSFTAVRISYNKREDLIEDSISFALQLEKLFNSLGVEISDIKVLDGNKRSDDTITKKVILTISNSKENIFNYTKIGFRYCKHKEIKNAILHNYLNYIEYNKQIRNKKYNDVISLNKTRGNVKNIMEIEKEIKNGNQTSFENFNISGDNLEEHTNFEFEKEFEVTEGIISDWLYPHKNRNGIEFNILTQMPSSVISFEKWNKKVEGEIIFLDVVSRKYRSTEQCYNITVNNENHNYVLNGTISKNCHHIPADTFKKVLNQLLVPYKLGLSATPTRLDKKEPEIFALVDNIKASISVHDLIKQGYVVRPDFYNISLIDSDINKEVTMSGLKGLEKARLLKQLSSKSNKKYTMLIKLLERLRQEKKTFLIFCDYVATSSIVKALIDDIILPKDPKFIVQRVIQEMNSDRRNNIFKSLGKTYGQTRGLIFARLGQEGIDLPGVDCIIIFSPSKSPVSFAQRTGRAMRPMKNKDHCEVYQFILKGTMEEDWASYSFDEFRQEGFITKNYVIR